MKKLVLLVIFFPISLFGQNVNHDRDRKFLELTSEINEILEKTKVVGISVAVIDNYRLAWAKGFGVKEIGTNDSVTTETLFQSASITKSVVALTIMREFQEGKVSLDSNVNKYLLNWKIPEANFDQKSFITLRQLLSHTAGISPAVLPRYRTDEKMPSCVEALSGKAPARNEVIQAVQAPGQFSYSSAGYAILQQVLEDVERRMLEDIVREKVFAPLGMSFSTFDFYLPNEKFRSIASGHLKHNELIRGKYLILQPLTFGSLWSTPTDLGKFLIEMQLSLKGKSNKIVDQTNAKLMLEPTPGWKGNYGLGFSKEIRGTGVKFFGHDGHNYGYICSMLGSVEGGFGLVIMTNSENGWKAVNQIKKLVGRKFWGF
jgi:CubicO group peptidase (beta-lactamase class C family)